MVRELDSRWFLVLCRNGDIYTTEESQTCLVCPAGAFSSEHRQLHARHVGTPTEQENQNHHLLIRHISCAVLSWD